MKIHFPLVFFIVLNFFQACPDFVVGSDLKEKLANCPNNNIAYASITGYTATQDTPLKSHYDNTELGVIQRLTLLEHRTKRIQGYW